MRKWIKIVIPSLLLAGGVILCVVRWQVWFGMPAEPEWTGERLSEVFLPNVHDTTPESLDFLVLGDIHNRLSRADYDTLAARVPQADGLVQIGDWLQRGQEYYYQLLLREWTNSALYGTPVIACPGNHEYTKGLDKHLSATWQKAFIHPHNGPEGVPGASYHLDFPSLRIIAIDTNPLTRMVYLTRTLTWVRGLMNSAGDRYTVVIMHHPVFSAAKGRFNALIYATFRHALGNADLVIAGHDHSYMRKAPFVVLNTSGPLKPQRFHYTPEVTDTVPVYGVLSIAQDSTDQHAVPMIFRVYHLSDGQAIDSLYVEHH